MNRLPQTAIAVSRPARLACAALFLFTAAKIALAEHAPKIQWLTPNGQLTDVTTTIMTSDGALKCALPQGDTTFIISLPQTAVLDRFDLVNENAQAEGELRIAIANYQLPPESSKWTSVDGAVSFSRKRLFNLSLVGVEARYVKLSFRVEKSGSIAAQPVVSSTAQVFRSVADQQVTLAGFDFAYLSAEIAWSIYTFFPILRCHDQ